MSPRVLAAQLNAACRVTNPSPTICRIPVNHCRQDSATLVRVIVYPAAIISTLELRKKDIWLSHQYLRACDREQ